MRYVALALIKFSNANTPEQFRLKLKSEIEYWEKAFVRERKRKSKSLFDISENIFYAVNNVKKTLAAMCKTIPLFDDLYTIRTMQNQRK